MSAKHSDRIVRVPIDYVNWHSNNIIHFSWIHVVHAAASLRLMKNAVIEEYSLINTILKWLANIYKKNVSEWVSIPLTCMWTPWYPTGTVVAIQIGIAPRSVRVIIRVAAVVSRRLSCGLWERIRWPFYTKVVVRKTPIQTRLPIYCVCDGGVVFKWCAVIVARQLGWNWVMQWNKAIWNACVCSLNRFLICIHKVASGDIIRLFYR